MTQHDLDTSVPLWGGHALQGESWGDRLWHVLQMELGDHSYTTRFAKARELFRLGQNCFFEQRWCDCATALVEGLLLDTKALPDCLGRVELSEGPGSCPFGRIVEELQQQAALQSGNGRLQLALLEVEWIDMQMLFARELCKRAEDEPNIAVTHQQRWFDLLLSLDDVARRVVSANAEDTSDRRILSRLTLVQAHYGANPPISRSAALVDELALRAVTLWPQDVQARLKSARPEDYEELLGVPRIKPGLLEADSPQYMVVRDRYASLLARPAKESS